MDSITLESEEAAFSDWRAQRSSRTVPIPEYLWAMALKLYPAKHSKICHRLRLSASQFKSRLESREESPADMGFVLASREEVKVNLHPSTDVQLTIQGKERAMTLCVSIYIFIQPIDLTGVPGKIRTCDLPLRKGNLIRSWYVSIHHYAFYAQ
jgi:hypothetical protein